MIKKKFKQTKNYVPFFRCYIEINKKYIYKCTV